MSSYGYTTEAHSSYGKNKDGGYGGPLCENPFGAEVSSIVKRLQEEAVDDKTLAFNGFTDPCPKLSKRQVASMQGFDYADKTKPLPCGPLPWPAGLPHPGFVPKTNPLSGRWITITGGDAEFVKKAIASGMLGDAEGKKINADVDAKKTGGMYLRITQRGEVCTVDASVAKFARANRTWKSGHYFYEPLVSGSHLFGVWVLPEEFLKVGFFYEMTSGNCFRIQRRAFWDSGYLFMRQSTEAFGKVSHVFYVKVSNDAESEKLPDLASRDFTALAGKTNVPDNLGNPYPCQPLDLDAPVKRDTWFDENKGKVEKQAQSISVAVENLEKKLVGYGWSTGAIELSVDALWEALGVQAREPEKFMEVTDVKISDEKGFLLRTMTISANKTTVQEHVMINREANEIVYQPIDLETGVPHIEERVIAIKNDPHLHLEYYQRDLSDGMRSPWAVPVSVLKGTVDKLIEIAKVMDETVEPVVSFGFHSPPIADVDHDELWLAMLKEARHPQAVIIEHEGFLERTIAQPEKVHQNVYVNEHVNEIVFRDLVDGKEQKTERAIVLRDHPLEIEMCERNIHSGFRVHSEMTKKAAKILMDAFVDSAKLSMKTPPTTVGLGVSSAPIHRASFDALFTAIETTIRQPWLVIGVDEASFKGEDCEGFYKRTMKINSTGEVVTEHVVVDEEDGEITYSKGGELERVVVIHKNPLRLEWYQRNAHDKVRKEWELPYTVAKEAMSKYVSMAKEIEERQSDTVDYGMHTSPVEYPHDAVWKAMVFWIRNPNGCGMKVDQVKVEDKKGHVLRSMRRISDNRVVTQHIRLNEGAQEILLRTVKKGEESNDECVLALRTEPLRCEFHCRSAKDEMRVLSKEPASSVQEIFNCIINAVKDQRG